MAEIKDKHSLEMAKLTEKGKTREAIAGAVKTGFTQVGAAVARTVQEMGTEEKRSMPGVTDNRYMWTSECPFCDTPITAPLSAKVIQCPNCGKQLKVTEEGQEGQPPPFEPMPEKRTEEGDFAIPAQKPIKEPEKEPLETEATFTVEQEPPIEQYPPVPYPNRLPKHKPETREEPELRAPEKPVETEIQQEVLEQKKPPQQVAETTLVKKEEPVKELAKTLAIGEGVKKREEELKKEPEKKPIEPDIAGPEQQVVEQEVLKQKPFVCDICGKGFDREIQLKGHYLHHLKEKKKKER